MNYTIYVRTMYSAIPKTIQINVDEKLEGVLLVIQGRNYDKGMQYDEDTFYYKANGVMSKDSGFNMVNPKTGKTGQGAGLFYSGISTGENYLDLSVIDKDGTYYFQDLIKTR